MAESSTSTDEQKPTKSRGKGKPLGTVLVVTDGVTVTRPDGSERVVSGTQYVLDVEGVHIVDGTEHNAAG